MAYEKTNWTNTTPINTTNLNNIENGIEQNSNDIENTNEKLNYSLEEQVIGTWINDKPVYRKVVDIGKLPNATNTTYDIGGITNSTVTVIRLEALGIANWGQRIFPQSDTILSLRSNGVLIETPADLSSMTGYIIIEYTKTTD